MGLRHPEFLMEDPFWGVPATCLVEPDGAAHEYCFLFLGLKTDNL